MITIYWQKGPSKGFTDLLPSWWLETDGELPSCTHSYSWGIRDTRARKKTAKCSVHVSGAIVTIDYGGAHTDHNAPNFDVGVLRLTFNDGSRTGVPKIEWRDADEADFEVVDVEWCEDLTLEKIESFDPTSVEDRRQRIERMVTLRQGQPAFRNAVMDAYERRCAITGCTIEAILEAAHISPYRGEETNKVTNGLLLRADLHTLFDLGIIKVYGDYRIEADDHIWKALNLSKVTTITPPADPALRPNREALDQKAKGN